MPDLTVSANVDTLMQSATFAAFRVSLGAAEVGANSTLTSLTAVTSITSTGALALTSAANGHITLMPNGTGNVGIGTTLPIDALSVNGFNGSTAGSRGIGITFSSNSYPNIRGYIRHGGATSGINNLGGLQIVCQGADLGTVGNVGAIYFFTPTGNSANSSTDAPVDVRLAISQTGGVSIGTTTDAGSGNLLVSGSLKFGGGATVASILTATAALNFGSILAAASADLTITVTGAAVNDSVSLGLPAAPDASIVYNAFVSAADTVTVRAFNVGAIADDPPSATIRVSVIHF